MAKKSKSKAKSAKRTKKKSIKKAGVKFPGMMGDGTEEQNLNQRGNPKARITKREVIAAFRKKRR